MSDEKDVQITGREGRQKLRRKKRNKRNIIIVLLLVLFLFSRVSAVVRLKAEQKELLAQQEELEKERDLLKAKLKNIDSKDYIQEQARKQLKMMDPDEIMYVFEDEK